MKTAMFLSAIIAVAFLTMGTDGGSGCASPHGKLTAGATADPLDPTHITASVGGQIDFAKRPLNAEEKTQIRDAAYNAGATWWRTGHVGDEKAEKTKLIDRLRYRYRSPWRVVRPIVEPAWEKGARAAGEPAQTSSDNPDRIFRENALKALHL